MKKFSNVANKVNEIIDVFMDGESIRGIEIARRLKSKGYKVNDANIRMFIYHRMLYKHIKKEAINGINYYSLIY